MNEPEDLGIQFNILSGLAGFAAGFFCGLILAFIIVYLTHVGIL